jgi:hypothetical protein
MVEFIDCKGGVSSVLKYGAKFKILGNEEKFRRFIIKFQKRRRRRRWRGREKKRKEKNV